jgi:hypothetical protein
MWGTSGAGELQSLGLEPMRHPAVEPASLLSGQPFEFRLGRAGSTAACAALRCR